MKKIWIILPLLICLIGCSKEEEKIPPSNLDYYKEVEKLEAKMQTLDSFKLTKTQDYESLVCDQEGVKLKVVNPNPEEYSINKDGEDIAYQMTQKMVNQPQLNILYYKAGNFYHEFSQMRGQIEPTTGNNDNLIMQRVFAEIDTNYYKVDKKEVNDTIVYTFTLNKAKEYNKKYPEDRDVKACNIVGDYASQKFVVVVNQDGYIIEERLEEKVKYKANEEVQQRTNIILYKFYDFNVPNEIDFSFL